MRANQTSRVEQRCRRCGRFAIITFRHVSTVSVKRRELPLGCPYEDCDGTLVQVFKPDADLLSVSIRPLDGARPVPDTP